jgi:ppGpp synthetase/RelA/SpoT-type nucleotidyltranferase
MAQIFLERLDAIMSMLSKDEFIRKYGIDESKFAETHLDWNVLTQIHNDYENKHDELESHAESIVKAFRQINGSVHSVKYRVKDPEHLIEKIIRKKIDNSKFDISISNYEKKITDLIGVRVLHLFKDEWIEIHNFITNKWIQKEAFTANIRSGDKPERFIEKKGKIKVHPAGYRSVHYLISFKPNKLSTVAEIQVRTIFEEAWSEIDHKVRYPYHTDDQMLSEYLIVFNRLAGGADDMASFLKLLVTTMEVLKETHKQELSAKDMLIDDLQNQLVKLDSQIEKLTTSPRERQDISATIAAIGESSKRALADNRASLGLSAQVLSNAFVQKQLFTDKALRELMCSTAEKCHAVDKVFQDTAKQAAQSISIAMGETLKVSEENQSAIKKIAEEIKNHQAPRKGDK